MELVVKNGSNPEKVYENVLRVRVEVDRSEEDGIWYFVWITWLDFLCRNNLDCLVASKDVNVTLDLKDRIKAALVSGVKRLEVTV